MKHYETPELTIENTTCQAVLNGDTNISMSNEPDLTTTLEE